MKKAAKFLVICCIIPSVLMIAMGIIGGFGEEFAGGSDSDLMMSVRGLVNGIGFSLISIYLCVNVIKYINKKLSLPVLMNKVADFLVLYGVLRLTLSFMSQYIEYSRISALFTEPDIMTFLFVGIAIKLALKTKQEKDYEISTAEKKLS